MKSIVLVGAIAGDRLFVASGTGFEAAAEFVGCVASDATEACRVIVVVGTQAEDNAQIFFAVDNECFWLRRCPGKIFETRLFAVPIHIRQRNGMRSLNQSASEPAVILLNGQKKEISTASANNNQNAHL
jgi:hypothetical protein